MENTTEIIKVVTKNDEIRIVYSKGVFQALLNDETIYEDDDYERCRFVAVGW